MKIKVKIAGRYRDCELLRAYRSKATGELGFVDVRVLTQDQCGGIPAMWQYVRVAQVRKADRPAVAETLPAKRNSCPPTARPAVGGDNGEQRI